MTSFALSLDLDMTDPDIEELIEDFFPEKIGTYNYDIRNKAITCYKDMISRSNRYETSEFSRERESQNSVQSFFTASTAAKSSASNKSSTSNKSSGSDEVSMSIKSLIVYAKDNHLKWSERETPITEKTQEIIVANTAYRYTIKKTFYLYDVPNKCFYKMYTFNSRNVISILSIIREIVLHNYAVFLNSKCNNNNNKSKQKSRKKLLRRTTTSSSNKVATHKRKSIKIKRFHLKKTHNFLDTVKIPKLENYFFNYAEDNTEIILKYEMLNIAFPKSDESRHTKDLKAAILSEWKFFHTNIVDLLTCFGSNGLYHNDSHRDNLCFVQTSSRTYSLAIIDFGKATLSAPVHSSLMGFIKPKTYSLREDKKQYFLNWIDRVVTSDIKFDDNTRYGGSC